MRAAPDCRPPLTARHASQPRSSSTSHPPQKQDAVHRELRPGTGKEGSSRGPEPAQDRCAAPHGRLRAPPGPRPRRRPPRRRRPTRHVPRQQQQAGGNEDILSSATGPSTARCSKDVTTHQHRPGARPGRPCPVPACSGQPLPGERRFSSALGNRVFFFLLVVSRSTCPPLFPPPPLYRNCGSAVAALRWRLDDNHHTIAKRLKRTQTEVYSHPSPFMLHETLVP
jgi:hypothetical protein